MVTPLLELNSRAATEKVLGTAFPAQSLIVSPKLIAEHPETVQRLVNAFVRAMRFINSHSVDEIVAKLPPDYFAGKDRAAEIRLLRDTSSTQAKAATRFRPRRCAWCGDERRVRLRRSEEGRWRAGGTPRSTRGRCTRIASSTRR